MQVNESNGFTYVTLSVTEISQLDFSQIEQTSVETLRRSIDDTQTIVKWVTSAGVPSCVSSLTTKGAYMTHDEALTLMATTAWTDPTPMH
jgi:hypothetical protein